MPSDDSRTAALALRVLRLSRPRTQNKSPEGRFMRVLKGATEIFVGGYKCG